MNTRRNFLAKIFSSAVAAPALAGIIARGAVRAEQTVMGVKFINMPEGKPSDWTPAVIDEGLPDVITLHGITYYRDHNPLRVHFT